MEPQRLPEVIARAQKGDPKAYEALLEAYGSRLYGYFLRALGSHHDAEDLLGEMTLRLVSRLGAYDDRGRFEPWLFRIAANLVRDRIRRVRTNPTPASLSAEDDSGGSLTDRLAGEDTPADQGLVDREASAELAEALEKLDELTRQMIILRHYGQLSYREIADLCECPVGTVLARVHRGLKALRRWMGADDGTK
jgi:RNA polymerase sigma-70 factor (ECF subfamily)